MLPLESEHKQTKLVVWEAIQGKEMRWGENVKSFHSSIYNVKC